MKKTLLVAAIATSIGLAGCQLSSTTQSDAKVNLVSGIEMSAIDHTVRPQDDFFRHVNGAWLSTTDIPSDKSSYSVFNVLYDDTQKRLKQLVINASESKAQEGSNDQKLGDMYLSYMNEALANELGISPLASELQQIEAVKDRKALAKMIGELSQYGISSPIGAYVYADAKEPRDQYPISHAVRSFTAG